MTTVATGTTMPRLTPIGWSTQTNGWSSQGRGRWIGAELDNPLYTALPNLSIAREAARYASGGARPAVAIVERRGGYDVVKVHENALPGTPDWDDPTIGPLRLSSRNAARISVTAAGVRLLDDGMELTGRYDRRPAPQPRRSDDWITPGNIVALGAMLLLRELFKN